MKPREAILKNNFYSILYLLIMEAKYIFEYKIKIHE